MINKQDNVEEEWEQGKKFEHGKKTTSNACPHTFRDKERTVLMNEPCIKNFS
jgi:hypothetical protein